MGRNRDTTAMITTNIRDEVRQRAVAATSERQMGGIIYQTLVAHDLDWRQVGNENVKLLLVDALRAYREARRTDGDRTVRVAVG